MDVTVLPPALGVRAGTLLMDKDTTPSQSARIGLRLTPAFEQKSNDRQLLSGTVTNDVSNSLAFVSGFFSSLLTNGLVTIELDFEPNREMMVVFSGVQRSASGYIGTGVGYHTSLDETDTQGFTFRFTLGTQARPSSRLALPGEVVLDLMFPTSQTTKPTLRVGVNFGLDLFP